MESAAQGRAAGVRIGVGSVPVKVRDWQKGRKKGNNECGGEPKKNAASVGALRRIEQKIEAIRRTANDQNLGGPLGGVYGVSPSP